MIKFQICIGHLTNDDILLIEKGIKYKNQIGGACMYSALGASIWTNKVMMVSCIGEGYNRHKFYKLAKRKSINVQNVKKMNGEGIKIIIEYDNLGGRKFVPKKKSGSYFEWAPKDVDIAQNILETGGVVHVAPLPLDIQLALVQKMKGASRKITLDPDMNDIIPDNIEKWQFLFSEIDYLLISEAELSKFFLNINDKWNVNNDRDIVEFCHKFSIANIVIKRAERGSWGMDSDGNIYKINAYPVNVVDCTGAGDAFAGGFGYGIQMNEDIKDAMLHGCISSSFAIEGIGISSLSNISNQEAKMRYEKMKGAYNGWYNIHTNTAIQF